MVGISNRGIYRGFLGYLNNSNLYGREGSMKIILIYPDNLGRESEIIILEWLQEWLEDAKQSKIHSPLRYVEKMEVEK